MNKQQIKELALANGFKLKTQPDGTEDLNPYVYEFAAALIGQAAKIGYLAGATGWSSVTAEDCPRMGEDAQRFGEKIQQEVV